MLPPLAALSDFTDRLGRTLEGAEATRAGAALRDASAAVRTEAGINWVDAEGDLVEDLPEIIFAITLAVARRVWDNPDGRTSTTEDLGAYNETSSWANASADIYLKTSERALIRSAVGSPGDFGGIGTLSTTRGDLETPAVTGRRGGFEGPPITWSDGGTLS